MDSTSGFEFEETRVECCSWLGLTRLILNSCSVVVAVQMEEGRMERRVRS